MEQSPGRFLKKLKNRHFISTNSPPPRYLPERGEDTILQQTMCTHVDSNTTNYSKIFEAVFMSINM